MEDDQKSLPEMSWKQLTYSIFLEKEEKEEIFFFFWEDEGKKEAKY